MSSSSSSPSQKRKSSASVNSSKKKHKTSPTSTARGPSQPTTPIKTASAGSHNSTDGDHWVSTAEPYSGSEDETASALLSRTNQNIKKLAAMNKKGGNTKVNPKVVQELNDVLNRHTMHGAPGKKKPPKKDEPKSASGNNAKKPRKQPGVEKFFTPYTPPHIDIPDTPEAHWGVKPTSAMAPPDPTQPRARDGQADTNPPLWEDRGYSLQKGTGRMRPYFGGEESKLAVVPAVSNLDQRDILRLKLLDMRAGATFRKPLTWQYKHGEPIDWTEKTAIKALNDRRRTELDKFNDEYVWRQIEVTKLGEIIDANPDGSIWLWTQLHNDYFMGKRSIHATHFVSRKHGPTEFLVDGELSEGRTVESVRHEYLTHRPQYDAGGGRACQIDENLRCNKGFLKEEARKFHLLRRRDGWGENTAELNYWRRCRERKAAESLKQVTAQMRQQPRLDNDDEEELLDLALESEDSGESDAEVTIDDEIRRERVQAFLDEEESDLSDVPDDLSDYGQDIERDLFHVGAIEVKSVGGGDAMEIDSEDSDVTEVDVESEPENVIEPVSEPEQDDDPAADGGSEGELEIVDNDASEAGSESVDDLEVSSARVLVQSASASTIHAESSSASGHQTVVETSVEQHEEVIDFGTLSPDPAEDSENESEISFEFPAGMDGDESVEDQNSGSSDDLPSVYNEDVQPPLGGTLNPELSDAESEEFDDEAPLPAQSPCSTSSSPVRSSPCRPITVDEHYSEGENSLFGSDIDGDNAVSSGGEENDCASSSEEE